MENMTDTLTMPKVSGFPPPVACAAAPATTPWPGQISQAPSLPNVVPAAPRAASVDANPFANAMFQTPAAPTAKHASRKGGGRRRVSWLLLLGVLGGIGYAGVVYGPELVERVTDADAIDEPAAPLVFPASTIADAPIRTATFTVTEPDPSGGTQHYEVTADFESGATRVVIPRGDTPDLEMLSIWDQSFIRRIDDPVWYSVPRGDFPIDNSLGRSRWVRTIDELVPLSVREFTTIANASESSVGTEPARRLVVSADATRLLSAQNAVSAASVDGTPPIEPPLPPGIMVQPGSDGVEGLTMEIWVDGAGIVRKSVMPPALGGETITVTSVSSEAWEPVFPTPDVVQPLTAQALFRLGI